MVPSIPTYLSHSYRTADREINEFFLNMLWSYGFAFTVDPKTSTLSTTHLEMMMRDSACFVGVMTRRDEQRRYRCSPFAVYEYGLAVQDHTPRLVFMEAGVPARHFDPDDCAPVFNRSRLSSYRLPDAQIEALALRGRAGADQTDRPRGQVGLVLPSTPEYAEAGRMIENLLDDAGYTPIAIALDRLDVASAARIFDACDFIIIDVLSSDIAAWAFPFMQGRFIPSIKLAGSRSSIPGLPLLPPPIANEALSFAGSVNRQIVWWHDLDELQVEIEQQINRLHVARHQFQSQEEGIAYFKSIGRAPGRVFLSTAQVDNPIAEEVGRAFGLANIDYFHYIYHNSIRLGSPWQDRILAKVREYPLFVPLLSKMYWQSDWCRKEMETALALQRAGRTHILPYFLDHSDGAGLVELQGVTISHMSPMGRVERIISDVDRHLIEQADIGSRPQVARSTHSRSTVPVVDVAIIVSSEKEHTSLKSYLDTQELVVGTCAHPNLFSWTVATLDGAEPRENTLLIARPGGGPNGTRDAVRATVDAFHPGFLLMMCQARAFDPTVVFGDVIVAEHVNGFSCGGPDHIFYPRPDWSFPTDPVFASAARAVSHLNVGILAPSSPLARPKVHVGVLAAGTSEVDSLGSAVFAPVAAAWPELLAVTGEDIGSIDVLDELRDRGQLKHFAVLCHVIQSAPASPSGSASTTADTVADLADSSGSPSEGEAGAAWATATLIAEAWLPTPLSSVPRGEQ